MAEYVREGSSALTVVVSIIVLLIIALAVYFGFMRGENAGVGGPEPGATEIEVNNPIDDGSGAGGSDGSDIIEAEPVSS